MTSLPRLHALSTGPVRARLAALTVLVATSTLALAACTDDGDPDPDPTDAATSSTPAPATSITTEEASKIQAKMPKERVLKLLGEPLVTQGPYGKNTQGCLYYGMENQPFANVWQFCFNDEGVNLVLTALSPGQPGPPEGSSQARASLIARADSVCQSQDGHLAGITKDVGAALADFNGDPTDKNLDNVVRHIGRFIDNLEESHEILSAFNPPEDNADSYTAYTDALADQIEALTEAKEAVAERDFEAYDEDGTEFNDIGKDAREAAQNYGFTKCSAADWG